MITDEELVKILLPKLNDNIERLRIKQQLLISEIALEVIACGLAWYLYGWQLFVILFLLIWAVNIKVKIR